MSTRPTTGTTCNGSQLNPRHDPCRRPPDQLMVACCTSKSSSPMGPAVPLIRTGIPLDGSRYIRMSFCRPKSEKASGAWSAAAMFSEVTVYTRGRIRSFTTVLSRDGGLDRVGDLQRQGLSLPDDETMQLLFAEDAEFERILADAGGKSRYLVDDEGRIGYRAAAGIIVRIPVQGLRAL